MFGEIAVTLEAAGPRPRFAFRAPDGALPAVTMLALSDMTTEELIWWLVPAGFVSELPFTVTEPAESRIEAFSRSSGLDPIEDLPPSDPRHQRALQEQDAFVHAVLVPLSEVTYGEVPHGFRQARPRGAAAPPLIPGRRYGLLVAGGSDSGRLVFEGV
jgi:hypothetical protein